MPTAASARMQRQAFVAAGCQTLAAFLQMPSRQVQSASLGGLAFRSAPRNLTASVSLLCTSPNAKWRCLKLAARALNIAGVSGLLVSSSTFATPLLPRKTCRVSADRRGTWGGKVSTANACSALAVRLPAGSSSQH